MATPRTTSLTHPADVRLARWVLAIIGVVFPLWGLLLWWEVPRAVERPEPRLLVTGLAMFGLILSLVRPNAPALLQSALTAVATAAGMVAVALAWANPTNALYQWHLALVIGAGALVVRTPQHATWYWTGLAGALVVALANSAELPIGFPFFAAGAGGLFLLHAVHTLREQVLQEQIVERTTLLREIYLNATDALFLVHPESGQILLANQRAADMFGVPELDLLLDRDLFAFPARALTEDELGHIWAAGQEGEEYRLEIPFKRYQGRPFWGDAAWRRIEIGDRVYTLVRITRIDERIAAQQALMAARDAAEAATVAKSNFLASISHEIRTPLNGVLGLASLLEVTDLTEEQQSFVGTLITSGRTLLSLIDELLDFSRIEAGELQIVEEPFQLDRCLDDLELLFRAQASHKGLDLQFDIDDDVPRSLRVDGKRLKQVLVNLLGNALKFTETGEVRLSCTATTADDADELVLAFQVHDTGIGIDPDDLPRLFEPFSQGDPGISRRFGGTGLGLAISKTIAERMGGTLSADSTPGHGSTFSFEVPARVLASDPRPLRAVLATEVPIDRRRPVLVAEDNPTNRMVITAMLTRLGCDVDTAHDGAEALEMAQKRTYDVVFMDVMMPGVDGLEATRRLRRLELARRPYVIALTAGVARTDRDRCEDAGMDDFVAKPIQLDDVRAALQRADDVERSRRATTP